MEHEAYGEHELHEEREVIAGPFRRYCARSLDASIYTVVFSIVMVLFFRCNTSFYISNVFNFLSVIVVMIIMIFLEPLLLSKFGTTIGKKICGLYVVDDQGQFLTYKAGMRRVVVMLQYGQGWNIPFYNLYRGWKSYKACGAGELLEWDVEIRAMMKLKDKKIWRVFVYILLAIISLAIFSGLVFYTAKPLHTGELTVSEFAENYNRYLANINRTDIGELDEQGTLIKSEEVDFYIIEILNQEPPCFEYIVEDGEMVGLEVKRDMNSGEEWIASDQTYLAVAMMAFGPAQEEYKNYKKEWEQYITNMENAPFESVAFEVDGMSVSYTVTYSGYEERGLYLCAIEGEEREYHMTFRMMKTEEHSDL